MTSVISRASFLGRHFSRVMGLLDAATGLFLGMLALPLFVHDMRQVVQLHSMLRRGEILLGTVKGEERQKVKR